MNKSLFNQNCGCSDFICFPSSSFSSSSLCLCARACVRACVCVCGQSCVNGVSVAGLDDSWTPGPAADHSVAPHSQFPEPWVRTTELARKKLNEENRGSGHHHRATVYPGENGTVSRSR